jgi:hypothetical protein
MHQQPLASKSKFCDWKHDEAFGEAYWKVLKGCTQSKLTSEAMLICCVSHDDVSYCKIVYKRIEEHGKKVSHEDVSYWIFRISLKEL